MNILNAEDFNQPPYAIPDASTTDPSGSVEGNTVLQTYINTAVADALIKVLGVSLFSSFIAALDALPSDWDIAKADYALDEEVFYSKHVWKALIVNPTVAVPPNASAEWEMVADSVWLKLLYGVDKYRYNSKDRTWKGVQNLLIPLVYLKWLADNFDDYTKVGVVTRKAENADIISPARRIANARNTYYLSVGRPLVKFDGILVCPDNTLITFLYAYQLDFTTFYDDANYASFDSYIRRNFISPRTVNTLGI